MNVIETKQLTRHFGSTRAVQALTMQVPSGSVCALLGENGSGKTTTIRLIMGALMPSYGSVEVFGEDPLDMEAQTRARIGYVADDMGLPDWMTLQEGMELHSSYFKVYRTRFPGHRFA